MSNIKQGIQWDVEKGNVVLPHTEVIKYCFGEVSKDREFELLTEMITHTFQQKGLEFCLFINFSERPSPSFLSSKVKLKELVGEFRKKVTFKRFNNG